MSLGDTAGTETCNLLITRAKDIMIVKRGRGLVWFLFDACVDDSFKIVSFRE